MSKLITKSIRKSSVIFAPRYVSTSAPHSFSLPAGMGALFFDEFSETPV